MRVEEMVDVSYSLYLAVSGQFGREHGPGYDSSA